MFRPGSKAIALAAALAVAGAGYGAAASAAPTKRPSTHRSAPVGLLERPDDRFARAIVFSRYRDAYSDARRAGVAPTRNLAARGAVSGDRLIRAAHQIRVQVREQGRHRATDAATASTAPGTYGVSPATLEAIASCESGGDPAAVSADGTYRGKYQFDASTWESVGGSGDPAAAPEAEQDMRAAMLYSEVGASAWPVCGQ